MVFAIFRRIRSAVQNMLEKGEKPEDVLEQYVMDLEQEIVDGEASVIKMTAEQKLLTKRVTQLKEKIDKRERQVREALETDNEEFAKRVMEDKLRLNKEEEQLVVLLDYVNKQSEDLRENLNQLKIEFQEMKLKRDIFHSKEKAASARAEMKNSVRQQNMDQEVEMEIQKLKDSIKKQ